jgi:hypothetical protein
MVVLYNKIMESDKFKIHKTISVTLNQQIHKVFVNTCLFSGLFLPTNALFIKT